MKPQFEIHYKRPEGSKDFLQIRNKTELKKCVSQFKRAGYSELKAIKLDVKQMLISCGFLDSDGELNGAYLEILWNQSRSLYTLNMKAYKSMIINL